MNDLTPPAWSAGTLDLLRRNSVTLGRMMRDAAGNLPYLLRREPRPQEWLDARTRFAAEWEALNARGVEQGFLEHDYCDDCAGELILTTDSEVVHRDPNPAYSPPPPLSDGATITIPRAGA